jgi:hypothetical protein
MALPTLRKGDIVFMDNLRTHKIAGIREALEQASASSSDRGARQRRGAYREKNAHSAGRASPVYTAVRIYEGLGVKFPGPTRQERTSFRLRAARGN